MKRLELVLLFVCCAFFSLFASDIRHAAVQTYGNIPAVQQHAFAKNVDDGMAQALPYACGTGSCSVVNGVASVMCTPDPGGGICLDANGNIALASTIAEKLTLSNTGPLTFSGNTDAGTTGVVFSSSATVSTVNPFLGVSASSTSACNDSLSPNNLLFSVAGSNSAHNLQVLCGGSVKANNNLTVAGTTTLNGGVTTNGGINTGTSATPQIICLLSTGCEEDYQSTSAPAVVYSATGGSGLGGTNANFQWKGSNSVGTLLLTLNGQGDLVDAIGNFRALGTSAATGEIMSGNATNVTGAKGTGAIIANGEYYQFTNCAPTVIHSAGVTSTLTLSAGCWMAKLTSSSTASDTIFVITYPGSVTLSNAPLCFVQDLASVVTEPTCTTTTTQATITYAVGIGATTAFANIMLIGNGI